MRCFGKFHSYNDRTCDLCGYRIPCIEKNNKIIEAENKLYQIQKECIYAKESFEEYNMYIGCEKDEYIYDPPICKPSLECEKYTKKD